MTDKKQTRKTIGIFAAVSLLHDMGGDMIYPIWPIFVTTVMGANMAVLGFIDGLGDAIVALSQAASGYASDRIQRRKVFIWLGYLCGSLSRLGYAASTIWQHLVPFRALDRIGKMRGAPRDAIIADVSTRDNRGRHFGILRAMDNLGAVCGTVLCIVLFKILGYKTLFLVAAIPSTIGVMLILLFIKERKPSETRAFKGLSLRDIDNNLRLFLALSAVFALGSFSYSFLLVYAKKHGIGTAFIPVFYLIFSATASLFSIPFGRFADWAGRKLTIMLSYIFWSLVAITSIFLHSYASIVVVFILYGLHKGALEPVQRAFVAELAPEPYRASTLGAYQMVIGLCALPSSLIAGVLWDTIGIQAPFYCSLALTVASIIMLIFVKEKCVRPASRD